MISGTHIVIQSSNAEADRGVFRDVLGFKSVDAGHGWLIFALPPAEAAFHPSETSRAHELYLMCDGLDAEIAALTAKGVQCSEIEAQSWGRLTRIALPGGGNIALYQPRHATALAL